MYFCEYCPYSTPIYVRYFVHTTVWHQMQDDDSWSDDLDDNISINNEENNDENDDRFERIDDQQMDIAATEPVSNLFGDRQKILFDLMALHRLWRVPRWPLMQMLELAQRMASMNYFASISEVASFERAFTNSGYSIAPQSISISSSTIFHIRSFKIGFITLSDHIKRAFKIPEYSRKLQLWQDAQSNDGLIRDLIDLPKFRASPLMQEDRRNILLLFYVDKVTRNRQVNTTWKNVWVLRCIPIQLPLLDRSDMANWWDLMFVPGFLLKEKGVNFFLKPFIDELLTLRVNGIKVRDSFARATFNCKADYFGIIGDLPAISNVVCFKEGGYSKLKRWCFRCFAGRTETLSAPPRTQTKEIVSTLKELEPAVSKSTLGFLRTYFGINDQSEFWRLPSFSLDTLFFDFFHTSLEGELKKITIYIFQRDAENMNCVLLSTGDLKEIDAILSVLPLRQDDERLLQFSTKHAHMSGHQMFNWLRVAIPTLVDFFPKQQCSCREGIRTSIAPDLMEYFDLNEEHQYWDHYVGIRDYCLFYLRATSHLPFSLDIIPEMQIELRNLTRLHCHLYGESFATIKTHIEAVHIADQFRHQGLPTLMHCFTPERDNKNIKSIKLNSSNVFYNLLRVSEIQKASQLVQSSSEDSKVSATGTSVVCTVDEDFKQQLRSRVAPAEANIELTALVYFMYTGITLEKFELKAKQYFKYINNNNEHQVARAICVILYDEKYFIYSRSYQHFRRDPATRLPALQPSTNVLIDISCVVQPVLVLPANLRRYVDESQDVMTAEETQDYFVQCTEFK